MLFTAVTLSFFAENIREHYAENEKKKHLLEIASPDFQRDLNQLIFHEQYAKDKIVACNSVLKSTDLEPNRFNQNILH